MIARPLSPIFFAGQVRRCGSAIHTTVTPTISRIPTIRVSLLLYSSLYLLLLPRGLRFPLRRLRHLHTTSVAIPFSLG
jgi:hypothetical protein